ncbi:unnamed protein product [Urochloa humidicola]
MTCYNCHQTGHHKSQCTNPSFCYGCKQTGHISSKCPNAKANKGLRLCGYGIPGQLFYSLNIPEEKKEQTVEVDKCSRAIITVHEGRGTTFRISTELNYLVGAEMDWQVKRLSTSEFLIRVPSMEVLNLLQRMGRIKFTCFDIQASVQETDRDPESFDMLQTVWVRAEGIPDIARKEVHVMELAYLVGDPEEVHEESLKWKSVWIKVACRDPKAISGTSEVFINKQGRKITWFVEDKAPGKTERNLEAKRNDDGGDTTDEEDPESQESYGVKDTDWLNPGIPPNQDGTDNTNDSSSHQGAGSNTRSKTTAQEEKEDIPPSDEQIIVEKNQVEKVIVDINQVEKLSQQNWSGEGTLKTIEKDADLNEGGMMGTDDLSGRKEDKIEGEEQYGVNNCESHILQMCGIIEEVEKGEAEQEDDKEDTEEAEQLGKGTKGTTTANTKPPQATRHSKRTDRDGVPMHKIAEQRKKDMNLDTSGAMWALWKTRNNLVFNNKVIADPVAVVYKLMALWTQWKPLLKTEEIEKVEELIKQMEQRCC